MPRMSLNSRWDRAAPLVAAELMWWKLSMIIEWMNENWCHKKHSVPNYKPKLDIIQQSEPVFQEIVLPKIWMNFIVYHLNSALLWGNSHVSHHISAEYLQENAMLSLHFFYNLISFYSANLRDLQHDVHNSEYKQLLWWQPLRSPITLLTQPQIL